MPAGADVHPWRRRLRFSVRGLIAVVLVCGLTLGWLVRSAQTQRNAVDAITKAGGSVKYNYGWTHGDYLPGAIHLAPGRLGKFIGIDYFGSVTEVWLFSSSTKADQALAQVTRFSHLNRLNLVRAPITDAGLVHLEGLNTLSELYLGDTTVSDPGLAHLRKLNSISTLDLSGTRVTDAGLAQLAGLDNLSILGLGRTAVTDAGLTHITRLKHLSSLGLAGTPVTLAGMDELKRAFPGLTIYH